MDSGEINKILGGVLGAVLVFLLLGFFSELIYFGAGGHEEEDRTLAFAVEVEESGGGEEEEVIDFGALLASADASSGASVFNKCKACHNLDGTDAVGPHLDGVFGRAIASVDGFAYSDALIGKEGEWDLVNLFEFIHNPSGWAPGTIMGFAGLPDNQDKVDLIVFLNEQGDSPVELVAPEMPETAEAEGEGGEEGAEGEQAAEGGGDAQVELIASADPEAGASVFKKCQACHQLEEGQNLVGPHLYGVVGREIASVEGFQYSDALASKDGTWDFETLSAFLHDPQGWAPGTIMGFAGLEDEQDRADVIAYLNQQSDAPVDLGGGATAEGGQAAADGEEASAETGEGEEAAAAEGEEATADTEEGEDGAVAAASGDAPEEELLETAEDAGKEETEERDAEDKGVPSDSSDVKQAELKDEEEAEAKLEAVAEGEELEDGGAVLYSEQESGTDEIDPAAQAEEAEEAETTGSGDEAAASEAEGETAAAPEPGSAASAEPEEVVDEVVETTAEVEANPTTALTEVMDEERVDPLPEADEAEEEAASDEAASGEAAGDSGIVAMLASADPEAGEKVFRKCSACHRLEDGKNTIGPHLYGVVGREIASVESYKYSDALASKEGNWDPAALDAFLTDPTGWAPGTKMGFAGLDDPQDRANIIVYLNEASDAPMEFGALPAPTRQASRDVAGVRLAGAGVADLGETVDETAAMREVAHAARARPAADATQ